MKTLRDFPGFAAQGGGALCVLPYAAIHGIVPPFWLTQLAKDLASQHFQVDVTTPSPAALGGRVSLRIQGNGQYDLEVDMHDSGATDYSFRLGIFLRSRSGLTISFYSNGATHGLSLGSRDFRDRQAGAEASGRLRMYWDEFVHGSMEVRCDFRDDILSFLTSALLEIVTFIAETVLLGGPAAMVILASEVTRDATGASLPADLGLVGLMAAEGAYFLVGAQMFIPVFIAGAAVTAALLKQRPMRPSEIAKAREVFLDTIPYDAITVTNLEKLDGREFTTPLLDGSIIVGAGEYYDDFLVNPTSRHIFIHELTHAWQSKNDHRLADFSCDGISRLVGQETLDKNRLYEKYYFYTVGKEWNDYNHEQQAEIVADWYTFAFENGMGYLQPNQSLYAKGNQRFIDEVIRMGTT